MKSFLSVLIFSISFAASAEIADFSTFANQRDNNIQAVTMSVKGGVPEVIAFSKDGKMTLVRVSSNNEPIDVNVGEVYDVNGNFVEGDVCNVFGKLKFIEVGFQIDFPQAGTAFSNHCPDQASLAGQYK